MSTVFYSIQNTAAGSCALVCNIGGALRELSVPDKNGTPRDVLLGFANPDDYAVNPYSFGALVGRYANRLRDGRFPLDGRIIQVDRNNPYRDCLHGGYPRFGLTPMRLVTHNGNSLTMGLTSPDGAGGFPGTVELRLTYTLTDDGALRIEYRAVTDQATVINLTNHAYFNLEGIESRSIADHYVTIDSDRILEVEGGARVIPTGNFLPVEGTALDLRKGRRMGDVLDPALMPEALRPTGGYDFNYATAPDLSRAAGSVFAPKSGIRLTVYSTEPALGYYTANCLDGKYPGKCGSGYPPHSGLCLESQHFPDSPNHPGFPSTVLRPDEEYRQTTIWQFSHE